MHKVPPRGATGAERPPVIRIAITGGLALTIESTLEAQPTTRSTTVSSVSPAEAMAEIRCLAVKRDLVQGLLRQLPQLSPR